MPAWKFAAVTGAVADGVSDFANSLIGDFRVGFLLETPSDLQFWAQAVGTVLSGFTAPGIFALFAKAWPCLVTPASASDPDASLTCALPAPLANLVVEMLPVLAGSRSAAMPIATSSIWFAVGLGALIIMESVVRKFWFVGRREWLCNWMPSWFGLGLGLLLSPKIVISPSPITLLPPWSPSRMIKY
jgi:uncharacterized oligopeptide transporter (OPT) family protein